MTIEVCGHTIGVSIGDGQTGELHCDLEAGHVPANKHTDGIFAWEVEDDLDVSLGWKGRPR